MKYFLPSVIFFTLVLLIVSPLFLPGFILTLDLPATQNVSFSPFTNSYFLFSFVHRSLSFVLPNMLIQKLLLLLILSLSYFGMCRIVPVRHPFAKAFAGFLYVVNPFVYERIVSGHWFVALGYSLFPWVVFQTLRLFDERRFLSIFLLPVLFSFLATVSLHFFSLSLLFFLIYFFARFALRPRDYREDIGLFGMVLGITVLLNLNWLFGVFFGSSELRNFFTNFTVDELRMFQSVPDVKFGLLFNLLSGYGFWIEAQRYYLSPKTFFPLWPLVTVALIGMSLSGLFSVLKNALLRPLALSLVILFFISLDFAGGLGLKQFFPTAVFLYEHIPILRGFREPQKLVGIILFCYSYFGSVFVSQYMEKFEKRTRMGVGIVVLVFLALNTLPMFFGFWGQLKPVWYPRSWHAVSDILRKDTDSFTVLFFPWHQYMRFRFNNNMVVSNPAPYFFDTPILSSHGVETTDYYTFDDRPEGLHVDGLLRIERDGVNLLGDPVDVTIRWGRDLAPIGVKYIILSKDSDWEDYRFLDDSADLRKIYEADEIILYQNQQFGVDTLPSDE